MTNSNNSDPKDQNVLSFMMQLVQEKHGDDIDMDFLNQESSRLYDIFGDNLVDYFEPMLTAEQKGEFDKLVEKGAAQDGLLNYLVESIPDLENQILQVLVQFRNDYLQKQNSDNTEV
ncbi:MAG: hypothetical protein QY330_02025 [Candidatus Dojkabacteria bacterium]|uniref:Uncharacterized protein n=1 Tax=candidate division WS6 bacterium OLB21 TaxID=1617427 RepID=A0A136KJH4_9BACT|nr:MAG: hypothetical protein UZ20_WS6002000399 [candidate division WS6 bacterium OLB21]WKZ28364.1 MAG: hypothetical protein QY330_02025 [Candidatus Dojkabacteria bacterium]